MATTITQEMDSKMQRILSQDLAPMTVLNEALDMLLETGMARKEMAHPSLILCHPDNRGGLGISARNMHETIAKILGAGADMNELKRAVCFEFSPNKRQEQLAFNERQISRADGLMAKILGCERYLSVGCGHTAAGCRAFNGNCKTSSAKLAKYCHDGKLLPVLLSDQTYRSMCETGWEWTVIRWEAEAAWPKLPDIAQRALNASNNVATTPAEPEVMAAICRFFESAPAQDEAAWDAAVEAAMGQAGFIAPYIKTLGDFVRKFGGGEGAPLVYFLDEFAQEYGVKLRLGKDFMVALTALTFKDGKTCVYSRIACMAINMSMGVDSDGVAKFILPGDLSKLNNRKNKNTEKAVAVETSLETLWGVCKQMVCDGSMTDVLATQIVGKTMCRMINWVLGKGKASLEKVECPRYTH